MSDGAPRASYHDDWLTGHRIDAPERTKQRFPPNAKAVRLADTMISRTLERERSGPAGDTIGLAGGASGGDILFHEACERVGIHTRLYLACPREAYVRASVQDGGSGWLRRFDVQYDKLERRVLSDSLELPPPPS